MNRPVNTSKESGYILPPRPEYTEDSSSNLPIRQGTQHLVNVALCALATLFVLSTPAILLPMMYSEIASETDWSFTQITAFSTLKFLSGAIASLLIIFIIVRISAKTILLSGVTISGVALFCLSAEQTPELFQALGFTMGAASIATSLSCKVILGYWFKANLGKAVGVAFMGGSVGGILIPVVGVWLIRLLGWQMTGALFGALLLIVVAPLIYFFLQERPRNPRIDVTQTEAMAQQLTVSGAQRPLLRDRRVLALLFGQFLIGAVDYALLAHTPLLLELDAGLDRSTIGLAMSLLMVAGIPGKLGFGWLYDKYAIRGVAFCWFLGALAALLTLLGDGIVILLAFCVLRGLVHGGVLISAPSIALHTAGSKRGVKLICILSFCNLIGAAIGTWALAHVQLATDSYDMALLALFVSGVIASLIACFCARKPRL